MTLQTGDYKQIKHNLIAKIKSLDHSLTLASVGPVIVDLGWIQKTSKRALGGIQIDGW